MDKTKRYIELLVGKIFKFDVTYHTYDEAAEMDFLTNLYGCLKIDEMSYVETKTENRGYFIAKITVIGKYFFPTQATEGDIMEHYEEETVDYIFKKLYHRMGLNRVLIYVNDGKTWFMKDSKLHSAQVLDGKIYIIR